MCEEPDDKLYETSDEVEYEPTDELCPECDKNGKTSYLFVSSSGRSPDNMVNYLTCGVCRYTETA